MPTISSLNFIISNHVNQEYIGEWINVTNYSYIYGILQVKPSNYMILIEQATSPDSMEVTKSYIHIVFEEFHQFTLYVKKPYLRLKILRLITPCNIKCEAYGTYRKNVITTELNQININ